VAKLYKVSVSKNSEPTAVEGISESDIVFNTSGGHSHNGSDSKLIQGSSFQFPIGAIYTEVTGVNPNTTFGYGTWSQVGQGKVLVGKDPSDPDFDTAGETGGAKTVQSSAQAFVGTPSTVVVNHGHKQNLPSGQTGSQTSGTRDTSTTGSTADALSTANPTGGSASYTPGGSNTPGVATSVVQPYLVVYFWQRTA
jgi:hypothetical protein